MKFIREASDLHLDWDIDGFHRTRLLDPTKPKIRDAMDLLWYPPELPDDMDSTFIVAGDTWTDGRFANRKDADGHSWIYNMSLRFKYVVIILGNHDYWGCNLLYEDKKIKESIAAQGICNVFLLEKDMIVLDQVKFIGGTLWTDYHRHDPMVMHSAPGIMKDYGYIRYGKAYRRVRTTDIYEVHQNTKSFIFANAQRDNPEQKIVVISHMAPSFQSVSAHYRQSHWLHMNFLYYTDLENRIMADGQDIDYWFHGHMHHSIQYDIGKVQVILNARGYANENQQFSSTRQIPV